MKKFITSVFILIVNLSFAQEKKEILHSEFFNTTIEENHYQSSILFSKKFLEIKELISLEPSNNSEGKFPKYEPNEITSNLAEEEQIKEGLFVIGNKEFIDNIIIEKLRKGNHKPEIYKLRALADTNITLRNENNFPKSEDTLNKVYRLSSKVEVEIGNNIYAYLNKIYKSEIDNTLQNSLNLLTIRF